MMKIYDPPRKMPFRRLHKGIYKGCVIRTIIPVRGRKRKTPYLLFVMFRNDKNHNPRKGTETITEIHRTLTFCVDKNHNPRKGTETPSFFNSVMYRSWLDKNHNPRKGTEAWAWPEKLDQMAPDKNHNSRKGTETTCRRCI